ncbi:MAG: DUF3429 domain-containing protein [Aestuariivita sp.]|nr:DUF3429 domain-containing protein [Aestuariivita sp.]
MNRSSAFYVYAGAIPFVICTALLIFDVDVLPFLGSTVTVLSVYTLIIVSFLAGSLWGQHLYVEGELKDFLPIYGNIFAISLWLAYLVLPYRFWLVIVGLILIFLRVVDHMLFNNGFVDDGYMKARLDATWIVIITLCISGFFAD